MTPTTGHREPPCPGCGQGMEVQAVCERCGHREAVGDGELRQAFMAGVDVGADEYWHDDDYYEEAWNRWIAGRRERGEAHGP